MKVQGCESYDQVYRLGIGIGIGRSEEAVRLQVRALGKKKGGKREGGGR